MPTTVPNQKIVHINRDMPYQGEGNFMLIKKSNFAEAYKDLNATALVLWVYLASNKDGFDLALSPQAVFQAIGMPTSTCRDQIGHLIAKGYLTQRSDGSNIYDFNEKPRTPSVFHTDNRQNQTANLIEINNNKDSETDNKWVF